MFKLGRDRVAIKAERTENRAVDKIQSNTAAVFRDVNANPFLRGAFALDPITNDNLITFQKSRVRTLTHGLQRTPSGVMVVHTQDMADLPETDNPTPVGEPGVTSMDKFVINYRMPSSCKAILWVW